ncbi:hypothetical protein FSP39_018648 [Pinctada imbricata]|uniref:BTB domain-containing protein n=1 Tax=Pinctada imbricata TaxID=66713 RepID=A0AA89C934_PINIB|nr:hypothetical protein FSP39_018648 [Pinctada imbricata]
MSDDNTSTAEKSSDDGPSEAKRLKTDSFPWEEGYTDITLIVEDKPIHTNKGFLMAASPIFKTMFLSAYKEKKAKKIPLPGKTYSDVVQFLQYLSQDVYTPFTGKIQLHLRSSLSIKIEMGNIHL